MNESFQKLQRRKENRYLKQLLITDACKMNFVQNIFYFFQMYSLYLILFMKEKNYNGIINKIQLNKFFS